MQQSGRKVIGLPLDKPIFYESRTNLNYLLSFFPIINGSLTAVIIYSNLHQLQWW